MIEISNELLSEVLINNETFVLKSKNNKIKKMWLFDEETNLFMVDFTGGNWFCINIYELAYKCKEWALSKGYRLLSGYDELEYENSDINDATVIINHIYCEGGCRCEKSFISGTEVEAIFEACEWVLKEIKK